jgi:peptidoglycan/xylan/chitin deacetylase (PgdA/CDA1 family)
MRPHGIMFHHFTDALHPRGQGALSSAEFRRMIEFLGPERILPAQDWLDRALQGVLRPWDICLTFDDNLRCQYDVAVPVLQEFGLTAFFFAYTSVLRGQPERLEIYRHFRTTSFSSVDQFYHAFFAALNSSPHQSHVDQSLADFDPRTYLAGFPFYTDADRRFRYVRDQALGPAKYFSVMDQMLAAASIDIPSLSANLWMTPDHLRDLHRQNHIVGLHSDTHPTRLADLSPAAQESEYQQNLDDLTRILGSSPICMSHPCNSYDPHTLRILRKMGIQLGFRANMQDTHFSPLEHPREDHANLLQRMTHTAAAA